MTPEQFCYWLQGYMEMTSILRERPAGLTEPQRKVIEDHLATVFKKVTPDTKTKGKLLNEELEKAIDDLQRNRPGMTCSHDTRIC